MAILFGCSRYGDLYTEENVAISGTHTHAGPGGYLQYMVYTITSMGFVQQSFDTIVDAVEKSIIQAHKNLKPGLIYIDQGHRHMKITKDQLRVFSRVFSDKALSGGILIQGMWITRG